MMPFRLAASGSHSDHNLLMVPLSSSVNVSRVHRIRPALAIFFSIFVLALMIMDFHPRREGERSLIRNFPGGAAQAELHVREQQKVEIKRRFEEGVTLLNAGQVQHAAAAFHRVLELDPNLPEAHLNMGFSYYELGNYLGAQRSFENALSLAPRLNNARYGLAISLHAKGDDVGAKTTMEQYLAAVDAGDPFRIRALAILKEVDQSLKSTPMDQTVPSRKASAARAAGAP